MQGRPAPPASPAGAQEAIQRVCKQMVVDGLVTGSAGNVSIRVGDRVVMSAGGVPYEYLEPGDHPVVDLHDGRWDGPVQPTSEMALHLGVMLGLGDVGAIVHTHSRYAAAFAVAGQDLPFICNENIGPRSQRILVTQPYAAPGSDELARAAVVAFNRQPGSRAVLLANHGVVAVGTTVEDAYVVATQVEWIAQICYLARSLGGERVLKREEQAWIARNYGVTFGGEQP